MKISEKKAYKAMLLKAEVLRQKLAALEYAISDVTELNGWTNQGPEYSEYLNLKYSLINKLNRVYEQLFFYVFMCGKDKEDFLEIKKMAYEKYFAEKIGIAQNHDFVKDGLWKVCGFMSNSSDEKEFISDIKAAMIEDRESLEPDLRKKVEDLIARQSIESLVSDEK